MLKKRSKPLMSDIASDSIFSKLFIDSDSAKSPTSPLDFKFFTNLRNPFVKSPKSPIFDGQPKSWDCNRVGLGLIDSLNTHETRNNILLGSQLKIQTPTPKSHLNSLKDDNVFVTSPKSLPKYFSMSSSPNSESFSSSELKNAQSGSSPLASKLSGSLPVPISAIELSEEYTCIISHGPNPKTTHIFGDCILDGDAIRSIEFKNHMNKDTISASKNDFLCYCFSCKKKLEQGEDIYIYRGDKAFCSCDCRDQEISSDEEMEKHVTNSSTNDYGSSFNEEIFISGMALAS